MSKPSPGGDTPASVRALVTGLVDYAGLFPPAQLGMREAMTNYAGYLRGPHAWILGRFVIPVARLGEFDELSGELLARGQRGSPWLLAALSGEDLRSDTQEALKFNCRHWQDSELGHALIDTIETRGSAAMDSTDIRAAVPNFFSLYLEAPGGTPASLLELTVGAGARAKIRMGGVTPDSFPPPEVVLDFMSDCVDRGLAFKATAGLHHLIRSDYALTYESGSPRAKMYGFLNVFLATVALSARVPRDMARGILLESEMTAFRFDDAGISWRDNALSVEDIARGRALATSYGSCSFEEPIGELKSAGILS